MSTSNNHTFELNINYNGQFIFNPITYQDGSCMKIIVPQFDFQDMLTYLKRELPIRVHSLYYALPQNNNLGGMKAIKNDYDLDVMFDIAKVVGELQIFVSEHPIDISTILIPDDGSLEESFACVISEETKLKREERVAYLHQMVQRKNKREERIRFKLGRMKTSKPTTPYTQTNFNFLVHNNGQLVCNGGNPNYVNGWKMKITIPRMKMEELKQYLCNIVDRKIHALYYAVPDTGYSVIVKLRNNYDMHVMFDISASQGQLEIYVDHGGVDFIISRYICPNATLAAMMDHVITPYTSDNEDEKKIISQTDYTFDQMVEWAEQEHFENEEAKADERQKSIWKPRFYN